MALCFVFAGVTSLIAQIPRKTLVEKKSFEGGLDISSLTYNEPFVKTKGMV